MANNARIGVTGATGKLGRLVTENLLHRGIHPTAITAIVRSPEKAKDLVAHGITVCVADYDQPETLDAALRGLEKVLLISANEIGQRVRQHHNVIEAALRVRVPFLAYTSLLHADTSPLALAEEHRQTEAALRASGLTYAGCYAMAGTPKTMRTAFAQPWRMAY